MSGRNPWPDRERAARAKGHFESAVRAQNLAAAHEKGLCDPSVRKRDWWTWFGMLSGANGTEGMR